MGRAYKCPICRSNREHFALVYKMAQEITKDPYSGDTSYYGDELETVTRPDGQPDLDVRCIACGYVGQEATFVREAQRDDRTR